MSAIDDDERHQLSQILGRSILPAETLVEAAHRVVHSKHDGPCPRLRRADEVSAEAHGATMEWIASILGARRCEPADAAARRVLAERDQARRMVVDALVEKMVKEGYDMSKDAMRDKALSLMGWTL